MRVVVALGGNALMRRGEPADAEVQRRNVSAAAAALAPLAFEHVLVVTHGNGPQVGLLALQGEAYDGVAPYPLDVLGAETEGMIGYLLAQELRNQAPGREVAALLTQVVVDAGDPVFRRPSKPVGPVYDPATGARLARERGWTVAPDGEHVRRVVPSPEPVEIVDLRAIRELLVAGMIVVCTGGGGIPVHRDADGLLHGVEGVVDKDLASALLAGRLAADALLLLTDVPAVELDWGTPHARPLRRVSAADLTGLSFAAGSMGPKVEAARRFVTATGGLAGIGRLEDAAEILAGRAGTLIERARSPQPLRA